MQDRLKIQQNADIDGSEKHAHDHDNKATDLGMFGRQLSFAHGVPYQTHTFEEELALLCFDL